MKKRWMTEEELKRINQRIYDWFERCMNIVDQSSLPAAEKQQFRIDLLALLSDGNIKIRKLRRFTLEEVAKIEKARLNGLN